MNKELLENNYIIIPAFIDSLWLSSIDKELRDFAKKNPIGDDRVPTSCSVYNLVTTLELLAYKTAEISDIIGQYVIPTYSYFRTYHNGSELLPHTDRPACEISLTVHIGSDEPWEFFIDTPSDERKYINLEPGDAILYLGCMAKHGRLDKYKGEEYTQVFLHYVRSRGACDWTYFDKTRDDYLIDFHTQLRQEYDKYKEVEGEVSG